MWMIIRNVCLLCPSCDFMACFGHLDTDIVISFIHNSYSLT